MGFRFKQNSCGFPVVCNNGEVTISFYDGTDYKFYLPEYIGSCEEDKYGIIHDRILCAFNTSSFKVYIDIDGVCLILTQNNIVYDKIQIELPDIYDTFIVLDGGHIRVPPARDEGKGMDRNRWYNGRGIQSRFLKSSHDNTVLLLEDTGRGIFYSIDLKDNRNDDFMENYFSKLYSAFPIMARTVACQEKTVIKDAYLYYESYTDYYAKGIIRGTVVNNVGYDNSIPKLIYNK